MQYQGIRRFNPLPELGANSAGLSPNAPNAWKIARNPYTTVTTKRGRLVFPLLALISFFEGIRSKILVAPST